MKNFEKVKAMSIDELTEFINKQATDSISDDFCGNYCDHRASDGGCDLDDNLDGPNCAYDDLQVIKKWLESEIAE